MTHEERARDLLRACLASRAQEVLTMWPELVNDITQALAAAEAKGRAELLAELAPILDEFERFEEVHQGQESTSVPVRITRGQFLRLAALRDRQPGRG